jgi:hypothetical protein
MNNFIKYALIRCIRTICQTAIATIGSAVVFTDVNWPMVISASCLAGILSLLTSVATGLPEVEYVRYLHNELEGEEDPDDDEIEEEYDDD